MTSIVASSPTASWSRRIGIVAVNGVQASSTSAQPSSSVRYEPLTSPQR